MNTTLFGEMLRNGKNNELLNVVLEKYNYLKLNELENISDFIYPFVQYTTTNLIYNEINKLQNKSIIKKIQQSLSDELLEVVSRTLVLEITIKKMEYKTSEKDSKKRLLVLLNQLIRNKKSYLDFFNIYPGLLELILMRIYFFSLNFNITVSRLFSDIQLLKLEFELTNTKVVDIYFGLGDSHNEGSRVSEIIFDDKSLIYKPRNNEISESINIFFSWLSKNSRFTYYNYPILNRGEYSWEEKIAYETCEKDQQIEEYFLNFGYTIAFIYLMNGIDFHYENVIVNKSSIVLIDAETLLHPQFKGFKNEYDVFSSGLLPNKNSSLNLSSLTGHETVSKFEVEVLTNIESDAICFSKKNITILGKKNLVTINNKSVLVSKEFYKRVKEGFKEFFDLIIKNQKEILITKNVIEIFNKKKVRVLLRATMQYHEIMTKSTHPDHIKTRLSQKKFILKKLKEISPSYYDNVELLNYETEVLSNFDIPYFYTTTNSNCLYSGNDKIIDIDLKASSYEQLLEKIKLLNNENVCKELSKLKYIDILL